MATNTELRGGDNAYAHAYDIVFGDGLRAEQNTVSEFWAMSPAFEPIYFELPRINPVEPTGYVARDWLKEWHDAHPVVLVPHKPTEPAAVPEPATYWMLAAALLIILVLRLTTPSDID
jgi:hypothetical protein